MRFIGCKENLLPFLDSVAHENGRKGGVFCDLFAGTVAVGRHFKKAGYKILSSDLLFFSYVMQRTYLEMNAAPAFSKLLPRIETGDDNGDIFSAPESKVIGHLNGLEGVDGFIFRHYTPEGTRGERYSRRYFTAANGRKIDAARAKIEEWKAAGWIDENERYYLLCALVEAVPFVSNISGTYAAFLKTWDRRALKPLILRAPEIIPSKHKHCAAHEDGVEFLARQKSVDVLYLDPPYNGRQYAPNYHILETVARGDNPPIKGVSGMRDYQSQKSAFCARVSALPALERILDEGKFDRLILSYNEEGLLRHEEILSLLKRRGKVGFEEREHARFKSNGNGSGRVRVKERAYVLKRIHPRNALNDMSGKEWLFFLNSVATTEYSTKGESGFAHDLRRIHPSPKPPQLMRQFVEFFTKEGGSVLDPFMGVGGVLLAASLCGREAFGVDLSARYIDAYRAACRRLRLPTQKAIVGDSAGLLKLLPKQAMFDLVLTDPPYGEMLSKKRTGQRKKSSGIAAATPFTDDAADLGNMERDDFLRRLRDILEAAVSRLRTKGNLVVFAKDMQPVGKAHNMLHCEVVEAVLEIAPLSFRGYKIWHDRTPKLYPFGYPHAFVANQLHQFALIFRKEK